MAGLSYVGLASAVVIWGMVYLVDAQVPARHAALGYGLGTIAVTILITGIGYGAAAAGRSMGGLAGWLGAVYGLTYAGAQLGLPVPVVVVLALALWLVSSWAGISDLLRWVHLWRGRR